MPHKGDPALGDFARQLLQDKPAQQRKGTSAPQKKSAPKLLVGIKHRAYHPSVYQGISTHIKERLKKLGG